MPDAVPTDQPSEPKKSLFEKMGAALPVALTALATILAGLSTGELSRAMYWRSTAAQDQAKAADQWGLAAHKRDRALMCYGMTVTLGVMDDPNRDNVLRMQKPPITPTLPHIEQVAAWTKRKGPPPVEDAEIVAVLQAIQQKSAEDEVLKLSRRVNTSQLEAAIREGLNQVEQVDSQYEEEMQSAWRWAVMGSRSPEMQSARFKVDVRRYSDEAVANQWVGFLYEVRVKTSTAESERHRQRSENFFFAMLAAQIGGVVSSLALARKRKSALWMVAGVAGLAAVAFGAFVYLTM